MHVHYFNCKVSPPTSYMYINIPTSCTVVCFVEVGFGGLLALLEPDTGMKKKSFEFLLWLHYNAWQYSHTYQWRWEICPLRALLFLDNSFFLWLKCKAFWCNIFHSFAQPFSVTSEVIVCLQWQIMKFDHNISRSCILGMMSLTCTLCWRSWSRIFIFSSNTREVMPVVL